MSDSRDPPSRSVVGKASIKLGDGSDVFWARFEIPKRLSDPPQLLLRPTVSQFDRLNVVPNGEASLCLDQKNEAHSLRIEVDELWFMKRRHIYWGDEDLDECTVEADLVGVWIKENFQNDAPEEKNLQVSFWVTANSWLFPFASVECSFDGSRHVRRSDPTRAELTKDEMVTFEQHHFWWEDDQVSCVDSTLVASYRSFGSLEEFSRRSEELLGSLNDYLLIVSLATNTRTHCFGWSAYSGGQKWSRYLPGIPASSGKKNSGFYDGLIDRSDMRPFFQRAYDHLVASQYKNSIRSAIYALVPQSSRTLESEFLAVFSSLEEILLEFRRTSNSEFILDEFQWKDFKSSLKSTIQDLISEKVVRGQMYKKIDELNRVPIADSYDQFLGHLGSDMSDLWPMFDGRDGTSLYQIRNMLTHGESLPPRLLDNLWIASEHLRWAVQRLVLRLLSWPISESNVAGDLLNAYAVGMRELKAVRADVTASLKNNGKRGEL